MTPPGYIYTLARQASLEARRIAAALRSDKGTVCVDVQRMVRATPKNLRFLGVARYSRVECVASSGCARLSRNGFSSYRHGRDLGEVFLARAKPIELLTRVNDLEAVLAPGFFFTHG